MTGTYNGGSIPVLDSTMTDVTTGIYVSTPFNMANQFSIVIDNLSIKNVGTAVNHQTAGTQLVGGTYNVESWVLGKGPTAGVVLMEWNMAESSQGSAGMWDSHFRIGGAAGSRLQVANCPKLTGPVNANCIAGAMMLHMTPTSSAYLENIWAWVSDHDMDSGLAQTQIDVYVARGILIESRGGPVWMYSTASEHCILYQYQLYGAKDVFMGNVQTESPYFLPKPQAPAPFITAVEQFPGDPDFGSCAGSSSTHCAAAWGLMVQASTNVHVMGAGLYNWFQEYVQPCVDTQDCQQRVVNITASASVWVYNLYTIGTVEMINYGSQTPILSKPNTNALEHPFVSSINAWMGASVGEVPDEFNDEITLLIDHWNLPECSGGSTSLEELEEAAAKVPGHCRDKYVVDIEMRTLNTALDKYTSVVKDGYDSKFAIYEKVVRQAVPGQIDAFMRGAQASGFFSCVNRKIVCCKAECHAIAYGNCEGCDRGADCVSGPTNVTVDCPTEIPRAAPSYSAPSLPTIYYTCTNYDGFYKAMADQYGIQKSWVTWGKFTVRIHTGCEYSGTNIKKCQDDNEQHWYGYPLFNDGAVVIANPKDIIAASYDQARELSADLSQAAAFADWFAPYHSDLADAASIPAFLMSMAVDSMSKVVHVADEIIEEERKALIVNFLTAVLFLIPMAGEVAGAFSLAVLRGILEIAGHLADLAITIYEVVDDPGSALQTIFGWLLGGGASRKPFKEAAAARRAMPNAEKDKLGTVKDKLDTIARVRKTC
ncbi:hypothetical protein B0T19DRAFT_477630 [Cercophora scortea]|uniref:Uncharacterized protein n=1 Tax=Cercophora scortea TaxID=314031 RepID=A0AAE0IGR1_9PEZI|nr:hypothetical protein B0T19DRAFT_477630 [Cercophora scortea]